MELWGAPKFEKGLSCAYGNIHVKTHEHHMGTWGMVYGNLGTPQGNMGTIHGNVNFLIYAYENMGSW